MKSLLLLIIILITAGNLFCQTDKPIEKIRAIEEPAPAVKENPDEEAPFSYVEQMPVFPEGQAAMYKFIYDNITYPEIAKQNGISGQVIVQFVILSDGTLTKAKVIRGIGGGCNEEALRVVNAMPKWNPGKHNGRPVPVTFTLPIKFVNQ